MMLDRAIQVRYRRTSLDWPIQIDSQLELEMAEIAATYHTNLVCEFDALRLECFRAVFVL